MSRPRFVVQNVTGFLTARSGATSEPPGLTAHVLDSAFNYAVVGSYRSEHRRDGHARAAQEAAALAERLNRDTA